MKHGQNRIKFCFEFKLFFQEGFYFFFCNIYWKFEAIIMKQNKSDIYNLFRFNSNV